jgi:hypothetical protein
MGAMGGQGLDEPTVHLQKRLSLGEAEPKDAGGSALHHQPDRGAGLVVVDQSHLGVAGLELSRTGQPDRRALSGRLGQRRLGLQRDAPPRGHRLDRVASPGDHLQGLTVGGYQPDNAALGIQGTQPTVHHQPGDRRRGPGGREPRRHLFQLGQPTG